jgi:hypothetical protein
MPVIKCLSQNRAQRISTPPRSSVEALFLPSYLVHLIPPPSLTSLPLEHTYHSCFTASLLSLLVRVRRPMKRI